MKCNWCAPIGDNFEGGVSKHLHPRRVARGRRRQGGRRRGVRKEATAYLQYLYSEPGQELVAKHYLRPRSAAVAKKYAASFKPITLFTIDDVFGGWKQAQKKHFDDGGEFDKIYQK